MLKHSRHWKRANKGVNVIGWMQDTMTKSLETNGHPLRFNCGVCASALTDATALLTSCGHFFCISPPGKCTRLHLAQAAGTCEQCGKECSAGVPYNRGANNNERVRSFVFDDIVQTLHNVAGIVQVSHIIRSFSLGIHQTQEPLVVCMSTRRKILPSRHLFHSFLLVLCTKVPRGTSTNTQ